jgi:hypothetical protein
MVPPADGASPAPIDRAILQRLQSRLADNRLVESVTLVDTERFHLRATLAADYYPGERTGRVEIRWYRNDDFSIHYRETDAGAAWECRWDRHPNAHNTRSHFHPPPDASRTDAADVQVSSGHRDVCRTVFEFLEERIETLWEQQY